MDDMGGSATPPPPPPSDGGSSNIPLAPRRPTETIGQALELLGRYWKDFVVFSAITVAAMLALGVVLYLLADAIVSDAAAAQAAAAIGSVAFLLFALVLSGAIARLIASLVAGRPTTVRASIDWGMSHIGPIAVVALLVAGVNLVIGVVGALLDEATDATFFSSLASLAQIVVWVLLSMSTPALVVEGVRGTAALRRSRDLVQPFFWHALGTFALAYLVVLVAVFVAILFVFGGPILLLLAFFALFLFVLPFFALVTVLLYVNLRVKSGGVTQATLADELARNA